MNFKAHITENVTKIVEGYCKGDRDKTEKTLKALVDTVKNLPRTQYKIETSDNAIKFNQIPLSFVRNWIDKDIYIMTSAEAIGLDHGTEVKTFEM